VKIRDIVAAIEKESWIMVRMKGSHRQFRHAEKPGVITVAGHPNDDLAKGTLKSIWKKTGLVAREKKK